MVLQVGRGLFRPGADKRPQLARCHGQRTTAVIQIAQAHAQLAQGTVGDLVEGTCTADLIDQPQLQVVLQVAANSRQFVPDSYPQAFQQSTRADAGALQNTG
ncbi:hypothetical protein D3C80_1857160 [compost metagenome]